MFKAMGEDVDNVPAANYSDIGLAASWAIDGINYCTAKGIVQGSGGEFDPTGEFTRQSSVLIFAGVKGNLHL